MVSKGFYRQDGYQKGFDDGRRTGGKVKKRYIENVLNCETQSLSAADSMEFMKGWEEGFGDGVRGVINNMVRKENIIMNHVYEFDLN